MPLFAIDALSLHDLLFAIVFASGLVSIVMGTVLTLLSDGR